ncbi:MAG TPA: VCBS repeat-containing protein [Desulfatiglandales bacterium]|nr:VCBS repeat-containing protein [Desulfatiglandales bacterium]
MKTETRLGEAKMNRNPLLVNEQVHRRRYCKSILSILFPVVLVSLTFSLFVPASASAKRLVLLPLKIYADESKSYVRTGVRSMLLSRLAGGDIEIIPDGKLADLLSEEEKGGITAQTRAEELTRDLGADYAVYGSITVIGAGYSLDLSLLQAGESGSTVTRVSRAVNEDQFIPQLADLANQVRAVIEGREVPAPKPKEKAATVPESQTTKGMFSKMEGEKQTPSTPQKGLSFKPTSEYQEFKPTYTIPVSMELMAFDTGDLDGDGMAELAVLGRKNLAIYQGQGERFVLKDNFEPSFGEEFLKVSVGDVDGNGKAEIYVVGLSGLRARTTVLEWAGAFHRLYRKTGHLQAIRSPAGGNPLLLFQNSTVSDFFRGDIYAMDYGGGDTLTRKEELPTLRGVQFYTLTRYDLDGDGNHEWLGFRDDERLYVWDQNGAVLWKGDEKIAGTNNAINIGEKQSPGDDPPRVPLDSRLLITDIDGDGINEILAIKNIPLVKYVEGLKIYTKSHLIAFRVEGTGLVPALTTRQIDYCLVDIQAEGSALFLAAQKPKLSAFGKGSGLIMWFE